MGKMSQSEMDRFLATGVPCHLGCLDEDGAPYVVPCWYHYADGGFYVIPRKRSVWARYLQADGRVILCMDAPNTDRVIVRGEARVVEEPNIGGRWVEIAKEMAYRYVGEEGLAYIDQTADEPRWLFFVEPKKITTWQGGGWAKQYKHYEWK